MSTTAKRLIGEAPVPPIEELLPEMIRIAEEGDIVERIAKFLISKGYTGQDVWREVKKLSTVSVVFTSALQNAVMGLDRGTPISSPGNPAHGFRQLQRYMKHKRRQ